MPVKKKPASAVATEDTVVSVKGFDRNLKCRDFQFEFGHTYEHDGDVEACASWFHACEYPLDVFTYYPPSTSRYAEVTQSGALSRRSGDSKIASAKITIGVELQLHEVIQHAVKWVFDRAQKSEGSHATGYQGAASSTGDCGAAMASGFYGRVMGAKGNALFLIYRNPKNGKIERVWSGIAGLDGIKPMVWYSLNSNGQPVECE